MKRYFLCFVLALSSLVSRSQEPQFTQFYASPLYLNPAYTGADICYRLATNYRNQWLSIPGAFTSYVASIDHSLNMLSSGIGIMAIVDEAGSGSLKSINLGILYSYAFRINRKWAARTGIRASVSNRTVDFNSLIFGDQLIRGASQSVQIPYIEKASYFDFSAGSLLYSVNFWAGVAADHLTEPNQSLLHGESFLPMKFSLHAGHRIPLGYISAEKKVFLSPAINYKIQKDFQQLDLGVYFSNAPMSVGLWYRGIPFLKTTEETHFNTDALAVLVGYQYERFKFGYSYDLTVSNLAGSTGGSHEISLSYQFCDYSKLKIKKIKKQSAIPCPSF